MKPTHSNALRRQLARSRDAGPHPDANLLSAFAEDALLAREREQLLVHLAACPSCRETLRISSAAAEEPESAFLPLPASRPAPSVFRNWITGAALAACIVAVAGSAILLRHAIRTGVAHQQVAVNQSTPATTTTPPSQTASAAAPRSTRQHAAIQGPPSATPKHPRGSAQPRATSSAPARPMQPAATEQVQVAQDNSEAEQTQEANSTAPTPPSQSAAAAGTMSAQKSMSPAPQQYSPAQSQQRAVYSSPSSSRSATSAGARTTARSQAPSSANAAPARGISSFAARPFPHPQWRIGDAGQIEHISDSGTWQPVPVGTRVNFRVVAVSHQEVWAGGDHLALFHSSDSGTTWTEVHLPATADRTHAIVNIDLDSAPKLTVESDAGVTWTTTDAGQTWQ